MDPSRPGVPPDPSQAGPPPQQLHPPHALAEASRKPPFGAVPYAVGPATEARTAPPPHHAPVQPRRSPFAGYAPPPPFDTTGVRPTATEPPPPGFRSAAHGFAAAAPAAARETWGGAQQPEAPSGPFSPPSGPAAGALMHHTGAAPNGDEAASARAAGMPGLAAGAVARAGPGAEVAALKGYHPPAAAVAANPGAGPPRGMAQAVGPQASSGTSSPHLGPQGPKPPSEAQALPPQQQQQPQQHPNSNPPPPLAAPPPGGGDPGAMGMRELRVEDALLYLDDVKREFRNQPGVYNEFLTIMKNFKTQAVDTPGVIQRVSKLFRGYNKLILGFNTFLPEGYKISLADLQRAERERQAQEEAERRQQEQMQAAASTGQNPASAQPQPPQPMQMDQEGPPQPIEQLQGSRSPEAKGVGVSKPPPLEHPNENQQPQPPMDASKPPPSETRDPSSPNKVQPTSVARPKARQAQKKPPQGPPPQQQHQAVEFDHAISYVTQIKRRFANDPNTYHSFLEILHTYQKEQRGIKEVLEQVAHLFQDHPDLLKEFTFFLPDAVQEQAKERLHRAAAESESRLASQRQAQLEQYHKTMQQQPMDGAAAGSHQQLIDMTGRRGIQDGGAAVGAAVGGRKRPLEGLPIPTSHQQPENFVYNTAVERQFFDLTKEALSSYSRDGGQAWAEFMKCLDMYAQEILSRTEMLAFVEPLLGKRNAKLFEEFKRILAAAGSTTGPAPLEDAWYSVPLSEIDFSRCRRCTPSYRALPRDYPAPPCTERSDFEAKVLNDVWVSLPVGSEESYTFRHMRRNSCEEQLFRIEDERFEIDMVIDSNAATLQRLLPFAEEIARLSKPEVSVEELGLKNPNEGSGIAGKRFQYSFDKNVLGVIHRNTISRIYGDSGPEMLELMVKNPVVTIPLVVERLRQKDKEWKRARDRLRVDWRKLAEANYYKSLDHRSLTWRTTDKRATSTRTLLAEIKDRSQNRGKEGKEALRQKLEKAKEEHGTFFEVTKADMLSRDLDLTFLPRPDRLLFTPHLSVLYENNSWAQRDAFRILSFALERVSGAITPHDKERCHRLWSEFLGPWFGLSLSWMYTPAVTYQESGKKITSVAPAAVVSEEEEDDSMDGDDDRGRVITEEEKPSSTNTTDATKGSDTQDAKDYHPLPTGCSVSTLYGEGKISEFRKEQNMYVIELSFGKAYLRPSTVLCSLMPAENSTYTNQLRSEDRSRLGRPTDQLVIGTQSLFLVFRLHQILIKRLNIAMSLAHSVGSDKSLCTLVEQMPNLNPKAAGRRRYEAYLALVYALLDGGQVGEYEDRVRSLLGHGAYELATMDKLISHIWKNIQAVAQDETMWNLIQLHRRHRDSGSFQPEAFRQEAAFLSDGEPMYAFQWCPIQGKDRGVLHFECLGVIAEEDDDEAMNEEDDLGMSEAVPEPQPKRQRR